jgi:8-oxo-dGTP pyrophosphatase MutT (NUDIX family)
MVSRQPFILEHARVIVSDPEERVLLLRHSIGRKYILPGGKVELGELPTATASRELYEETGLKADCLQYLEGRFRRRNYQDPGLMVHLFWVEQCGGCFNLNRAESDHYVWLEASALDDPFWAYQIDVRAWAQVQYALDKRAIQTIWLEAV